MVASPLVEQSGPRIPELSGQKPPNASNLEPGLSSEAFQKKRWWDLRKDLFVPWKRAELLRFKSTNLQIGVSPRADPTLGGALATRDYCFKLLVSGRSLENRRVTESARPLQQPLDPFRIWKRRTDVIEGRKEEREKGTPGVQSKLSSISARMCL